MVLGKRLPQRLCERYARQGERNASSVVAMASPHGDAAQVGKNRAATVREPRTWGRGEREGAGKQPVRFHILNAGDALSTYSGRAPAWNT